MNTIILTKNFENYSSGYYHHDINKAFMKRADCYLYGEGYPRYGREDTIEDVIAKSPFDKENIGLIVVSTSWEVQQSNIEDSDPHPMIKLNKIDIPKVFFLNKEYKKLNKKLEYAKNNSFDLICTAHHNYKKWARQTGLNFVQLPFAADSERFKNYGLPKKYDFGFTGSLHRSHSDIRYNIKCLLFKKYEHKSNLSIIGLPRKNLLKNRFKKYKIYWAEWGARNILGKSLLPSAIEYARFLNSFKIFLSTPSATGIIGTRYFECMGAKTLVFCPESPYYSRMFRHGNNCIMFKEDLSDFMEKFYNIVVNDGERNKIIEEANKDFLSNHTYDKRIEPVFQFLDLKTF